MAVSQKEIETMLKCPVCGGEVVQTSSHYVQCRSVLRDGFDAHGKVIPLSSPGRFRRVKYVSALPIAEKIKKKSGVYLCDGKEWGRIAVRDAGVHAESKVLARYQPPGTDRWLVICLVPAKATTRTK